MKSKTNCKFCGSVVNMGSKCGCTGEKEHFRKTLMNADITKDVIVKNVDIEFGTLVWFLVKLAFAMIPAAIIITIIAAILFAVFGIIVEIFI
tara:strand:- start:26 stop:301 length:276 start_codon:yes stop_codon:yes gene_type:complete